MTRSLYCTLPPTHPMRRCYARAGACVRPWCRRGSLPVQPSKSGEAFKFHLPFEAVMIASPLEVLTLGSPIRGPRVDSPIRVLEFSPPIMVLIKQVPRFDWTTEVPKLTHLCLTAWKQHQWLPWGLTLPGPGRARQVKELLVGACLPPPALPLPVPCGPGGPKQVKETLKGACLASSYQTALPPPPALPPPCLCSPGRSITRGRS